jgi:two-component system, NarL family, nitrate/nitrite response regulator NarL
MRTASRGCDAVPVRCLIIDDSLGFLAAARRLLEGEGITIAGVATNGVDALREAERVRPDLALVDIDLGGESGLELVGRLPVPAILISTHDEQDYRDLIAASPAVGFLPKATLSARAIHDLLGNAATGTRET